MRGSDNDCGTVTELPRSVTQNVNANLRLPFFMVNLLKPTVYDTTVAILPFHYNNLIWQH